VATAEGVFLIDALERGMGDLNKFFTTLFSDKSKIKLFHAYDHDLKWIHEDFGLDAPLNSVLDTSKINMEIHNTTTSISLKNLALQELDFEMQKDYQKSDWRLRPLFR
jgi:ribonuclease D